VHPTGSFLYAANSGGSNISQYKVDSTTGLLTPLPTATVTAGAGPSFLTSDVTGNFVFVANVTAKTIVEFSVDLTTGGLTSNSNIDATASTTSVPSSLAVAK
jgi:6-phosphogluconolactonase (cycloisomerase 2 family)